MRWFSTIILVLAMTLTAPVSASGPRTLAGTWRYVGGTAEVDAMHAAVDDGVAKMSFVARPFAKYKLKSECPPAESLRVELADDAALTAFDSGTGFRSAFGVETAVPGGAEGLTVRRRMDGPALVERWTTPRGGRENRYRLTPEGSLELRSTIFSARLPEDISFSYTYAR